MLNDSTKYQQVLINVLSNAVMYSPANSTVEVTISSCRLEDQPSNARRRSSSSGFDSKKILLSVIVQDKGPGISQEDQAKLFQPFTTLTANRNLNPKGVGISLYVCKLICEKLGGDISCFSNPD